MYADNFSIQKLTRYVPTSCLIITIRSSLCAGLTIEAKFFLNQKKKKKEKIKQNPTFIAKSGAQCLLWKTKFPLENEKNKKKAK